jgi:hypothetical protein
VGIVATLCVGGPTLSAAHPSAIKLAKAPVDRRERRPVSLRGFAAHADGRTCEVLVLDLSYDGCGIEIPIELAAGDKIKLRVLSRGLIGATVRWYSGGRAGLVFDAEQGAEEPRRPRQASRLQLEAEVSMRRLGQITYRVRLFDMSPHGCKIAFVERGRIGEHVVVKFEGLEPLEAEVMWLDGFTGGIRFEKPFHPAVFDLIAARLGAELD